MLSYFYNITLQDWFYRFIRRPATCPKNLRPDCQCIRHRFHRGACG